MSHWRFAAMIATSTLVMFDLMYLHAYIWDHVYFSETRAWMALLMGAVTASSRFVNDVTRSQLVL